MLFRYDVDKFTALLFTESHFSGGFVFQCHIIFIFVFNIFIYGNRFQILSEQCCDQQEQTYRYVLSLKYFIVRSNLLTFIFLSVCVETFHRILIPFVFVNGPWCLQITQCRYCTILSCLNLYYSNEKKILLLCD